jgi:tetratricopeptide (TPR) repeat protein
LRDSRAFAIMLCAEGRGFPIHVQSHEIRPDRGLMKTYRSSFARVALAATLLAGVAGAADKSPTAVRAEALFDEGRKLMNAGDFASACPKFAESQTLDPAPGTALNLANCYEKAGKFASAWAAFRSAEAAASAAKQKDRAAFAKKKVTALQPQLSRLTISVSTSAGAVVQVQIDDQPVQGPEWGVPVPRDGGSYTIVASAPGKETWTTHIELRPTEQNLVVEVPPLVDTPRPVEAARPDAPAESVKADVAPAAPAATRGQGQRTVAYVVGGLGVAGLGTAGVFGLLAESQWKKAQQAPNGLHASEANKASNLGNASTIAAVAGGALAATGIILWITSPRGPITVGANGSELFVNGSF